MLAKKNTNEKFYLGNPSLPEPQSEFDWTPEMMKNIQKCKKNILYFAQQFFYIVNLDEGRQKIKLYKYQKRILKSLKDNRFTILLSSRQSGKALKLDTPILTPNGWTTIGEIKDNDKIFGADGKVYNVIKAHDVMYNRPCYKITFDNGEEVIADEEHLWNTQTRTERHKKSNGSTKTTKQILETLNTGIRGLEPNHRIYSCVNGVNFEEKKLIIPPYLLGLWLGDGGTDSSAITIGKRDINDFLTILNEYKDYKVKIKEFKKGIFTVRMGYIDNPKLDISLQKQLREQNLLGNKHIPNEYMFSSREQRLELLKGLIDSDGYIDKNGNANFYNTNLNLVKQVKELVESLGYKVNYKTFIPKLNGIECAECGVLYFKPREYVCKISFKKNRIKLQKNLNEVTSSNKRNQWFYIKNVEKVESVPVRCLTVDSPDNLFLCTKSLIPTHNSTLTTIFALWLANFFEDQSILLVANKEATAINIFSRIRLAYQMIPNYLKSGTVEWGKTGLTLGNGSSISITTTSSDAGRGSSCNCLILDEFAFVPSELGTPFWNSVFPIISASKKSKIFITSTPNGTGNLFHTLYVNADKGLNNWKAERVDWWDVPGRDQQWKDETIKAMGNIEAFSQEYENKFIQTGESATSDDLNEKFKQDCRDPKYIFDDGHYKVWEEPNPNSLYIAGVDIAEGVNEAASVVQVFDVSNLSDIRQVASYHNRKIIPFIFTKKLLEILQQWGSPPAAIERNNCGAQVIDQLRKVHNYEGIVCFSPKQNDERLGCIAHTNTKGLAVTNMRYWTNQLQAVIFRDVNTVNELKDFVRYPNGTWAARAGTDMWDDRVTSTMWALSILIPEICERHFEVVKYNEHKKPLIIRPLLEYGQKTFVNLDMFRPQDSTLDGDAWFLPSVISPNVNFNPDISELEEMGWRSLV